MLSLHTGVLIVLLILDEGVANCLCLIALPLKLEAGDYWALGGSFDSLPFTCTVGPTFFGIKF